MRHIVKILLCASLFFDSSFILHSQELTLDSCLALARKNNADIRSAQLDVDKAHAVKQQAVTNYFPKLQLGSLGYLAARPMISFGIDDVQSNDARELLEAIYEAFSSNTDISDHLELMRHGLSGSVSVMQPVFVGGRIVNGNRLATIGEEASQLQAEVKERDILEQVEASYYLVVGLQEKVSTIEAALSLIDSLDRIVSSALANGLVTKSDALQLQLKRNEMLSNHHKLTSGIRLARRHLCSQIGIPYSDSLRFIMREEPHSLSLTPHSSFSRPETRLLQLNVQAQQLMKKMTLGESLPQLAIMGIAYYGNIVRNDFSGNAIAGFSLSIPLTDWWQTSRKLQEHDIRIEQAHLMEDNYNNLMSLEEEKAYSDMVDALLLIRSDSSALDLARENYRLASLNYQAGNTTLTEVLQAQTLLLQAQNALTDRRISYLVARRRLIDLTGEDNR